MSPLKLYLSPTDGQGFKVIFNTSGACEGETECLLPFFEEEKNWRSPLFRCLEMTAFDSRYFSEDEQAWMIRTGILDKNRHNFHPQYLVNIGQRLFQALFPPDSSVKNALHVSLRSHEAKNTQLHMQLSFADDVVRGRLADYPWELLHDGNGFLLLNRNVTISRYIAYERVPPNLPPTDKVNVLLVSSTAFDDDLGLKKLGHSEVQAIHDGLKKAKNDGHINFVQLEATRDQLRAYLTEHRGEDAPQVLHFDGHGLYGKRCTNHQCCTINKGNKITNCRKCNTILPEAQGYLVFEDGNEGADYVSAKELGVLLSKSTQGDGNNKSDGIALVVLSACQSAMTVEGDSVFNGIAQNLIGQRIPSVVAMQYSVSVTSASEFAKQFYRSLGKRNSLAIAISQAREPMGIENNQWYRPVLYLRWQDNQGGQLFKDSPVTFGIDLATNKLNLAERLKKETLEQRLVELEKDYQALERQHREAGDADDQSRLQSKLDRKLEEIKEITKELNQINDGD